MKNKEKLRQWAKNQRQLEKNKDKDETILKKIKSLSCFIEANSIMLFYPLENELNLLDLLNENKVFSFPRLINNKIVPYKNNEQFQIGRFNIPEPQNSTEVLHKDLDLIIVPALCVDLKGNRIGYGKGYYDKFIKELDRDKTTIVVGIYDKLVVNEIETDEFDEKVDIIITEERIVFP